jgi:Xaa-Pro aminopeptidase
MQPFADRRERMLGGLAGGVAVIPSARLLLRNGDSEYEFRQNSDFYYLTGFDEPDAVLVLSPKHPEHRSVLFLRERDRAMEIWNGKRLGVERASEVLGIDKSYPIGDLDKELPNYLVGADTLHYELGTNAENDRTVMQALEGARSKTRRTGKAPSAIVDPGALVHQMRSIKSADEAAIMRRGAAVTRLGYLAAMRATRPGLYEYEIEALMEYEYRRNGARREAYESIVAGGDNATILHYCTNREVLRDGDLLLIDSGAEYDYYATDVTRTWPVNGRFTAEQRAIYEIVEAAHAAAAAHVRPGEPQRAFHHAAVRTITEGLVALGLLKGSVDENIEHEKYRDYYMHGTGHWLGLDVHDAGRYRDENDDPVKLQPGMVTTVEPGIYVHRDLECDERFKGIGVRIEDDLLVTTDGHENLTAGIPKSIEELERIVGTDTLVSS